MPEALARPPTPSPTPPSNPSPIPPSTPPPTPAAHPASRPVAAPGSRARQVLVVLLAVVSGATDAIGLMVLGGAFTSVMTGNLVILGVSASTADGTLAVSAGGAVVAFCLGAALGTRLAGTARPGDPIWPRPVTLGLTVELVLMVGYAVGWWVSGAAPGPVLSAVLLFVTAGALGIQSSVVLRFGVGGLSTTYLTGTLTTVVTRLVSGRGVRDVRHSLEILVGLVGGAAAGAGVLVLSPPAAPVLQVVVLGAVVVGGLALGRRLPGHHR